MTHHDKARELVERLDRTLGGVTVPNLMHGDNLAITLCTAYDNPDQDTDDETGWTPDAISGQKAVLSAIRAHYAPLADLITALAEENRRLREAIRQADDILEDRGFAIEIGARRVLRIALSSTGGKG